MKNIDPNFFKPIVQGAVETFQVQCEMEVETGKPYYKGDGESFKFNIAGVIGLTSSAFTGSIALCFQEPVFLGMMSNMLGEEFTEINDDIRDGAAELMNIIFGQAKTILNQQGHDIEMAIPTVVSGKEIETIVLSSSSRPIVIPFETEKGKLAIEISINEAKSR